MQRYLAQVKEQNIRLKELFTRIGRDTAPTPSDRALLAKWRSDWKFSDELVDAVADFSVGKTAPMAFMDKILTDYHDTGIATVEAAREDHQKHLAAYQQPEKPAGKPGKTVIEQRYEQREYDPKKYVDLTPKEIEEALRNDT